MKITNKEKNRISELYSSKLNLDESKTSEFRDRVLKLLDEQNDFLKNLQQKNREDELMRQLKSSGTTPRITTTTTQKPKLTDKEIDDIKKFISQSTTTTTTSIRPYEWGSSSDVRFRTPDVSQDNTAVNKMQYIPPIEFNDKEFYGKSPLVSRSKGDIRDFAWFEKVKFLEFIENEFPNVKEKYKNTNYDFDILHTKALTTEFQQKLKNENHFHSMSLKEVNIGDEWYLNRANLLDEWKNTLKKNNYAPPPYINIEIDRLLNQAYISTPGSKVPKQRQIKSEFEREQRDFHKKMENARYVLEWISFIAGWIPHPVAQGIAYTADAGRALTYLKEGDYTNAGLETLCMVADVGIDFGMDKTVKYLVNKRNSGTLKNLGDNINSEKNYGVNSLDLLTKGDMEVIDAISDNKNLQKIYDGMDQYQKKVIDDYLTDPEKFKNGYNMDIFLNTKKPSRRFEEPNFKEKYWKDYRMRTRYLPLASLGRVGLQGYLHVYTDQKIREFYPDIIYRNEIDKKIRQTLQELGITYKEAINEFGGDPNNKYDVDMFEKAWLSPKISSTTFGKKTFGWRPTVGKRFQGESFGETKTNTLILPCEFYGSLNQEKWRKYCT